MKFAANNGAKRRHFELDDSLDEENASDPSVDLERELRRTNSSSTKAMQNNNFTTELLEKMTFQKKGAYNCACWANVSLEKVSLERRRYAS